MKILKDHRAYLAEKVYAKPTSQRPVNYSLVLIHLPEPRAAGALRKKRAAQVSYVHWKLVEIFFLVNRRSLAQCTHKLVFFLTDLYRLDEIIAIAVS